MAKVHTAATRLSLSRLAASITLAAGFALRDAMQAAAEDAKATTLFQDRRGKTRKSIKPVILGSGFRGRVIARGAATWLEYGTRAHIIRARRAKALRFVVNGATLFRRSVQHPGTAPRPFMAAASRRGQMAADFAAEIYVNRAIGRTT